MSGELPEDVGERLEGQESIVHGLHHNLGTINYLTFDLHNEPFSASNNVALSWICRSLLTDILVDFYKLLKPNEKYSFEKILNVAQNNGVGLDYPALRAQVATTKDDYAATPFEQVRSRYIAHQDINVPVLETDLWDVIAFNKKVVDLFFTINQAFGREITDFSEDVVQACKEIFNTIDEYERVKAHLIVEQIEGKKVTSINDIAKLVDGNDV